MSAGSGASNLGYGNIAPFSNVNGAFVNKDSSNAPIGFSSTVVPGTPPGPLPGLAGAKSNVDAAAGVVPGICMLKGGAKRLKRKIKNITKQYKRMKAGSRKIRSMKRRIRRSMSSRRMRRRSASRRRTRSRAMRGGYGQYQNNLPMTPTYKVAGVDLPASQLALANPPPITKLSNCVNCIDNCDHFSGHGFPSKN